MKLMLMTVIAFFTVSAFAGIQAYNSTTNLGVVSAVKCSTGLSCTKVGEKVVVTARVLDTILQPTTGTTLTGAQCGSTILNSPSLISINLPTGSSSLIGCHFKFQTIYASGISVNPDDSSTIYGLTVNAGSMILNSTKGSYIDLMYGLTNTWFAFPGVVSGGAIWTNAN